MKALEIGKPIMVIAFLLFMVNTLRKKLAEERRWNIERL
jgi:hypothetical protein